MDNEEYWSYWIPKIKERFEVKPNGKEEELQTSEATSETKDGSCLEN